LLEFSTIGFAIHNTGLIILGGWDYEMLADEHPVTAFLWTGAFIVILFLIFLNMALAIVMDVHSEAVSSASNSQELWTQIFHAILNTWSHRDWMSIGEIKRGLDQMPPEVEMIKLDVLEKYVEGIPGDQAKDLLENVDKLIMAEDEGGVSMSDAMSMVGWITHAVQQILDKVDYLQMLEEDSLRMVAAWTKHLPSDSHGPIVFIDFDAHSDTRLQILEKRLGTMADIINENMGYAVQQGRAMQNAIVLIEDLTRLMPQQQNNGTARFSPEERGPSRGPPNHGFSSSYSGGFDRSYSSGGNSGYGSRAPQRGGDQYGGQRNDPWELAVRPQGPTLDRGRSGSSTPRLNQAGSRQVMTFNV
jgi:hypothetical protein